MTGTFTAGTVLAAASLNTAINTFTVNTQTGTSYTLVLSDAGKLVTLSNGSPVGVTIPLNSSVAFATGTTVSLLNLGAGLVTVSGAGGVTLNGTATISQNLGATLIKTGTDTWSIVSGGLPKASVSSTTGTPTTGSFVSGSTTYDYWRWTGTGTVSFSNATNGQIEVLVVAGGGGSGATGGASGGAGGMIRRTLLVSSDSGTFNITVGAGGAGGASTTSGSPGTYSAFGQLYAVGGGRGGGNGGVGGDGGSGGGTDSGSGATAGQALAQQGNNGAVGSAAAGGGGGAGAAAAGTAGGAGVTDNYDGTSREYSRGGGGNSGIVANTGWGANWFTITGASGVVIMRIAR